MNILGRKRPGRVLDPVQPSRCRRPGRAGLPPADGLRQRLDCPQPPRLGAAAGGEVAALVMRRAIERAGPARRAAIGRAHRIGGGPIDNIHTTRILDAALGAAVGSRRYRHALQSPLQKSHD